MTGAAASLEKPGAGARAETEPGAEEAELVGRLLASAMGLARICVCKVCRRRKRCLGPCVGRRPGSAPICFEHHRGLARKRMGAAIALIAKRP